MFLFETFDYNEDWAKANYSDFRSTWSYLDSIVNDYKFITLQKNRKDYVFNIGHLKEMHDMGVNNVFYAEMYHDKHPLEPFLKKYLIEKLTSLGDAVKILSTDYDNNMKIIFSYDITKDEVRWNAAHKRILDHLDTVNAIQVIEPDDISQWMWMLDCMSTGKNPRIIFKKFKEETIKKLWFIAKKIGWNQASINLYWRLSWLISQDDAKNYGEALDNYLKTYVPDEEIQEITSDFKDSAKTNHSIPPKAKEIGALLQKDDFFSHFDIYVPRHLSKYDPIFEIEVETHNGHKLWIVIKHYDLMYRIDAYKTRNTFKRYDDSLGSEFKDQINNHFYMVMKIGGIRNVTLKLLLETYWDKLMEDIRNEYK